MQDKLNILIVASWYPSNENPTYGSFVEEQAQLLVKKGHKVTVLQPNITGKFLDSLSKKNKEIKIFNQNGLRVISVTIRPVLPKFRTLTYNKLSQICCNVINDNLAGEIDVIHAHSSFMGGIVAQHLSKKFNIPYVITEHSSGLIFNPSQYTKTDIDSVNESFALAKKVIFVSTFFSDEIRRQNIFKVAERTVIPNLVSTIFFTELKKVSAEDFRFLSIGSLIPVKNHMRLITAFSEVLKNHPNCVLTIAGDGPLKNNLILHAKELQVFHKVNFKDKLSRSQVLKEFEIHDVTVSSSIMETFGLTIAESLACGTPVIVTDSGGIRDVVNDGDGLIVENSTKALSEGMNWIIDHFDSLKAQEIHERAKTKFHEDVIYAKVMDEYKQILN